MTLHNLTDELALDATLTDGTQKSQLVDAGGTAVDVTAQNALKVDGSDTTQPVSASSLPLPTGAATEATLSGVLSAVDGVESLLGGSLSVSAAAVVDTNNSTTTPLGGGATFTGTATDVSAYTAVSINVYSDVASATDGLSIEWSQDGTNWNTSEVATVAAATAVSAAITRHAQYFRLRYTNGGSAQSVFRIEVMLVPISSGAHASLVRTGVDDNQSSIVTKSVIHGRTTAGGGSYVPVKVNPSGAMTADVTGTVAVSSSALPTGAATSANQTTLIGHVDGIESALATLNAKDFATQTTLAAVLSALQGTLAVSGPLTDAQLRASDVPVSASSLPLPTGAATAAKQPALGTAGTPSADVITVQGVTSMTALKVDGSAVTQPVSGTVTASSTTGNVAHDASDSGNPVKVGGRAISALSGATMVAAGDRADLMTDLDGALIVRPGRTVGDIVSERVSDTAGTSAAFTNFGATASVKNVITGYSITNTSSSMVYVDFRDGTSGAVLWTVPVPANGGANLAVPDGIFKTSANTALAYDVSAATTTVYISVSGYRTKA